MKLQIKTLHQKSLMIDIDADKTVYDLKRELSLYPDVGVKAELQKLIYAGKVLTNDDQLSSYNIDAKKFLVVMILKQPLEESPTASSSTAAPVKTEAADTKVEAAAAANVSSSVKDESKSPAPARAAAAASAVAAATAMAAAAPKSKNDELVDNIVGMGYPESEVRRALAASFYNPERAIEYLIEGIPTSPSTPEGGADFNDTDMTMSPFEMFRSDPLFRNLRRAIQQHPELIDDAIQRVGEANPSILSLIDENQQEFLSMLVEGSDDEEGDDDDANI